MQFVLVHSPLVGPTTWRRLADSLQAGGHDVVVPDLRAAAVAGDVEAVISTVVAAIPAEWPAPVVVGHSGAGPMLSSVAQRVGGKRSTVVFVDAGLPPCEAQATPSGDFLEYLRALASDGLLPKWSTWWGEGVMEVLVPDADRRGELDAEMPQVSLAQVRDIAVVSVSGRPRRGTSPPCRRRAGRGSPCPCRSAWSFGDRSGWPPLGHHEGRPRHRERR